jgi:hypothetical protein
MIFPPSCSAFFAVARATAIIQFFFSRCSRIGHASSLRLCTRHFVAGEQRDATFKMPWVRYTLRGQPAEPGATIRHSFQVEKGEPLIPMRSSEQQQVS